MTKRITSLPSWTLFCIFLIFFLGDYYLFGPRWDISLGTMVPVFFWIYSLGMVSSSALPKTMKMSSVRFQAALAFTVLYHIITSVHLDASVPYGIKGPFMLLAWFSFLYSIYYVTKCIKSIELNREAMPLDLIAIFFGLLLYPIGVWFIQPKIQHIARNNNK
jgi:hypothetical protein